MAAESTSAALLPSSLWRAAAMSHSTSMKWSGGLAGDGGRCIMPSPRQGPESSPALPASKLLLLTTPGRGEVGGIKMGVALRNPPSVNSSTDEDQMIFIIPAACGPSFYPHRVRRLS